MVFYMDDEILKKMDRLANPSFLKHIRRLENTLPVIPGQLAIDKAVASFATQRSAIDKAMATFIRPSTIDKAIASFAMQHSAIEKMIGSFTLQQSAIEKTISSFTKSSSLLVGKPNYLSELASIISTVDISTLDTSSFEDELEQSCSQLEEVDDGKSFVNVFRNLPPSIQVIFWSLFINVFLAQINSISANLLTPIVESHLESMIASDRDKVKRIKKIPLSLGNVDTGGLRFITGNNVRLRIKPSTNSEIIDELVLGQVVTVLSKNRNWIEVMYEYEDGGPISGWVFTRYTANFVQES